MLAPTCDLNLFTWIETVLHFEMRGLYMHFLPYAGAILVLESQPFAPENADTLPVNILELPSPPPSGSPTSPSPSLTSEQQRAAYQGPGRLPSTLTLSEGGKKESDDEDATPSDEAPSIF